MTNEEAIERLRKRICCEKPVQHFCTDNCMYGVDECEIAIAIDAIDKQIPRKLLVTELKDATKIYQCAYCDEEIMQIGWSYIKRQVLIPNRPKYCYNCGQRLDWEDENDGNKKVYVLGLQR